MQEQLIDVVEASFTNIIVGRKKASLNKKNNATPDPNIQPENSLTCNFFHTALSKSDSV